MAGKLKVDLSGVKSFFLERGEKIALVLAVLAAGLLITMGVLDAASVRNAPGSDKPYGTAMEIAAASLKSKVDTAPPDKPLIDAPENNFVEVPWEWNPANPRFQFSEFSGVGDNSSTKRLNPRVVPVVAGAETCAMWYVPGAYFSLDIEKQNQKITIFEPKAGEGMPAPAGGLGGKKGMEMNVQPVIVTKPVRMVVVSCIFPMQEQLKAFQDAFRMQHQYELWMSKDLPHVLGLNIWKAEVIPGKAVKWEPMIVSENKGGETKLTVDPALRKLFREAYLDEDMNAFYRPFLMQGLAMPLPKLAILPVGMYPPVKLAGLEIDENTPGLAGMGDGGHGMGGGGIPGLKAFNPFGKAGGGGMGGGIGLNRNDAFPWRNLSKNLQDKLNDRTNVLDPLLVNFDSEEDKKAEELNPLNHENKNEGFFQGGSQFASYKFWGMYPKPAAPVIPGKEVKNPPPVLKPYDALVRFVDPTVEPGKTYKYLVQVRMANPNYGKKEEVAFPALADVKELPPSDLTETPTISIPGEYHLYAVDQKPALKVPGGADYETPRDNWKQEQVAVQIHRWVDESRTANGNYVIGDWAIAERLYIRRGDAVGREINVEVPVWNSNENRFELGKAVAGGAPKVVVPKKGIFNPGAMPVVPGGAPVANTGGVPINFQITNPPPVLVDFDGGKREFRLNSNTPKVQDEAMSNLLILRADGSLIVRNTKLDSEAGNAAGKERLQRIETWLLKTAPLRGIAGPGGERMPVNPGGIFGKGGA